MASAFGQEMSDEPDQLPDGSPKHVRLITRLFRDSELKSVGAVTMPTRSAKQKRLASELNQRVARRNAEFAKANDEMRREIDERRKIMTHLLESQGALYSSLLTAPDRARAKLPGTKQVSKQMLCGISPIGDTSPVKAELSSEESAF